MRRPRSLEKWAVFISGRGSNLQSVLDLLDARISLVVSNSEKAPGILKANRCGVPVVVFQEKNFAFEGLSKSEVQKEAWQFMTEELRRRGITRIFLLGFMKLLPAEFVSTWQGRILNVHPSLLPNFPGLHAIEKSHAAKAPMGVTVHEVIAEMDAGKILLQRGIPLLESLTRAQLLISMTEQQLVREAVRRWS